MPIYDYVCGACGHLLEVIHGIYAEGPRFCPSCGAEGRMKKAVAAPAVVYKGAGWAKKDRRVKPTPAKASSGDSKPGGTDKAAGASGTSESGSGTSKDSSSASSGSAAAGGD